MKRTVFFWQVVGFLFTAVVGILLHFLYDWTGESIFVAPISGVNESTWEHMKLLYFPLAIYAFYEKRYFKDFKGYWCVKLIGIIIGLTMIPVLFYTYNGAFGKSPDWINITIFFVAAAISFITEYCLFKKDCINCKYQKLAFLSICFIGVLFVLFTFFTPKLPIFKDPVNGVYGIDRF